MASSTSSALMPADQASVKVIHAIADAKLAPDTDLPFWVNIETQIIGHMQNQQAGSTAAGEEGPGDGGMGQAPNAGLGQPFASGLPSGPIPGAPSDAMMPPPPGPGPGRGPMPNPPMPAPGELARILSQG